MLLNKLPKRICILSLFTGASLLGGCGGEKPAVAAAQVEKAIFTSALDCESGGQLTLDVCSKTIEAAVAAHEKSAPSYKSQASCEEKEGTSKCERIAEKLYRPRLSAFLITASTPAVAFPLYLTKDAQLGFRTADMQVLLEKDDNLTFSKSARHAYEAYASKSAKN